jgi:hypothetical protein
VLPLQATLDASAQVNVGPTAPLVALGGGTVPLVLEPGFTALVSALQAFATGLNPGSLASAAAALVTALTALPPAGTTKVKAV